MSDIYIATQDEGDHTFAVIFTRPRSTRKAAVGKCTYAHTLYTHAGAT